VQKSCKGAQLFASKSWKKVEHQELRSTPYEPEMDPWFSGRPSFKKSKFFQALDGHLGTKVVYFIHLQEIYLKTNQNRLINITIRAPK
jgi:hypothetical protein